jgi:hypothetical protein
MRVSLWLRVNGMESRRGREDRRIEDEGENRGGRTEEDRGREDRGEDKRDTRGEKAVQEG